MQTAALVVGVGVVLVGFRWTSSAAQLAAMEAMLEQRADAVLRAAGPVRAGQVERLLAADPQLLVAQVGDAPARGRTPPDFAAPDWPASPRAMHKPGARTLQPIPSWYGIAREPEPGVHVRLAYDAAPLAAAWHAMTVPALWTLAGTLFAALMLFALMLAWPLRSLREATAFAAAVPDGPPNKLASIDSHVADIDHLRAALNRAATVVTEQRAAIAAEQARLAADMAERERQAEDLARSAGLLRAVFDTDSSMLYLKDADGRFVMVNAAFLQFWRLREEGVVGRHAIEVFGDEPGVQASLALDRRAWAGEATAAVEEQVARDGQTFDVMLSRRLVDAPGGRRLLLGVARDVTLYKLHAARLERERGFTREVIDRIEHGVFVKDASMRYLLVNDAYAKLCRRPREALLGRTPQEVFGSGPSTSQVEGATAADYRVLATGVSTSQEDVIDFGAGPRRCLAVKGPITLADGVTGVLAVVRDVTDERAHEASLRQAMERAQAAVEARSRFVAHMSHEIRTPINGIMGMTDLVLASSVGKSQREWLTLARQSADNLLAIVNDVLDLAKMDAGATTVERAGFDLHDAIVATVRPIALRAASKGLEFELALDPDLPAQAVGDVLRLRQVLTNLLGNAIKFTERGAVTLAVACGEDGRVFFRIDDTGPGIDAALHERIFEPFAQADESTTRRYGGTGLGLPISRQLVGLMGGRCWLDSVPGGGSCFGFELPLCDGSVPTVATPLRGQVIAWLGVGGHAWAAWAEHWGAEVLTCTDPQRAQAATARDVDVVVIDRVADVRAYAEALQAWRGQARLARLVWIEPMTASPAPGPESPLAAARGLPQARLSPPYSPAALLAALAAPAASVQTPSSAAAVVPRLSGRRVLLAEDNAVNRTLASTVLAQLGAVVTTAVDGRQALACLDGGRFDLVLMDIQMPELDGSDVVIDWRARESEAGTAPLPIIAMTAHAMAGDRDRFMAQGFDGYVGKPFTRERLLAEIERVAQVA